MKKSILFCLIIFSWEMVCFAQQLPLFTQYQTYQGIINPAAISSNYIIDENNSHFGLSARIQWSALEGAPRTNLLQGEYLLLTPKTSLLIGGYVLQDKIGPTSITGAYVKIAGILSDGDPYYGGLSLGITMGISQFKIRAKDIDVIRPNDPLLSENQQQFYPDIGLGLFVYKQLDGGGVFDGDKVYFGLSVPQVVGLDVAFKNSEGEFAVARVPHYYATLGIYKFLANDNLWHPSIWVKYAEGVPLQIDVNARFQWANNFYLGLGFSNNKILHLETGFLLGNQLNWGKGLKIGYGYDHSFTTFGPFTGATHELNLSIALDR